MYDIFISYRRIGGGATARLFYEKLKEDGFKVFYDIQELNSGYFDVGIFDTIKNSKDVVLILPPQGLDRCSDEKDWIRQEIECALNNKKNIIPITLPGFEWPTDLPSSISSISRINAVNIDMEYFDACYEKLISMLSCKAKRKNIKNSKITLKEIQEAARIDNKYFSMSEKSELKRLSIQQKILKSFDSETYNTVINSYDELRILDVGSNIGDMIMDRLGKNDKVRILIGLEYDKGAVQKGNDKYGKEGKIAFFDVDVSSSSLDERIEEIMEEYAIVDEKFNVINLSMILLHMSNPYKLLKTLRRFLSDDGIVIVRDIDDGLNLAYPDEQHKFERVIRICSQNETSGYRKCGRQIYTMLRRAGFSRVKLEKIGVNTAGMNYEERDALFDTYFSFVLEDLEIMKNRYPGNVRIEDDYEWYSSSYDSLQEEFQDSSFFFNLGFVLFTAKK